MEMPRPNKSTREILEIILDNIELIKSDTGLCHLAILLNHLGKLKNEEYIRLIRYIRDNRPSKFSSINAFNRRNSGYYWSPGSKRHRIKWLRTY
jgi:hypothetical protein